MVAGSRPKCARARGPWTSAEVRCLLTHWRTIDDRELVQRLSPRSWRAITVKAKMLGLPQGMPAGCESFSAAMRRTGYDRCQLQRILSRCGVPIHGRGVGRQYRWAYVSRSLVDRAVADQMRLESLLHAASRLRISRVVLARLVRDRGYPIVHRQSTRLPPETYDRIVDAYRQQTKRCAA